MRKLFPCRIFSIVSPCFPMMVRIKFLATLNCLLNHGKTFLFSSTVRSLTSIKAVEYRSMSFFKASSKYYTLNKTSNKKFTEKWTTQKKSIFNYSNTCHCNLGNTYRTRVPSFIQNERLVKYVKWEKFVLSLFYVGIFC